MMPKEDTYTKSKLDLKAMMAMSLGGRAAEEIVFGDITTGAAADIQHLTDIARKMVCQFGMSEKLGPVKMGDFTNHPHMRIDGLPPDGISNETEREIDLEVRALVDEAYANAKNCLIEHRDQLEKIANALLEKETISIDEINTLLGLTPPVMQAILLDTPAEAPVENTEAENSAAENSDEQ